MVKNFYQLKFTLEEYCDKILSQGAWRLHGIVVNYMALGPCLDLLNLDSSLVSLNTLLYLSRSESPNYRVRIVIVSTCSVIMRIK